MRLEFYPDSSEYIYYLCVYNEIIIYLNKDSYVRRIG